MTQDRSTQPDFPTSTSFAADFLARVSRSPDTEKALRTLAERCFSRLPEYLEPKSPLLFCLKTYPDCYRMTKGGPSPSSSGRFLGWGIMSNGRCLTARILTSPNHGSACSLSGILERDVPEKILPILGTNGASLVQVLGGAQGSRVYDPEGIACTQAAQAGGMGGKTGLYAVGFNRKDGITHGLKEAYALNASNFRGLNRNQSQTAVLKTDDASFIDLCAGNPKLTDTARCVTANYGKTTLCYHKGERSGVLETDGVLLIKEATKCGFKPANIGDTVDLSYATSNTRRGRVGRDVAHTLDTGSTQGVVTLSGRIRKLTPRECFRLQGYREDQIDKILAITSDSQAYKQAGNGVTVNVVYAIGLKIKAAWDELYGAGDTKC